jgi:hypothetical protein
MSDCATNKMRFETEAAIALEAAFDGGRITSDGGLLWLARADSELGLCETLAEYVPEWRARKGHHSLVALIRQRVFQIACGYEDQNDSDTLRQDPLLKLVCGKARMRLFARERPRSGKPTDLLADGELSKQTLLPSNSRDAL